MQLFSRKKKSRAGLLIDRGIFRYLAVQGSAGSYSVTDHVGEDVAGVPEFDDDPFVRGGMNLERCFSYLSAKISDVKIPINVSLPTSDSLLRIVNLPGMTLPEAKLAFRYEFENYFPFPAEEGIFDMAQIEYPLPNNAVEKRFIVCATRLALVENIMTAAAAHGFVIEAIEPAQIAIERAVTPIVSPSDASVSVYAGRTRSVLILSWKGNGVFYRSMSIGFDGIDRSSPEGEVDFTAQQVSFVKEVRSSLQFALSQIRGFDSKELYICGPGADNDLSDMMRDSLSVEQVIRVDCMDIHGIEFETADDSWEIPIGLALR